jgi:uncharacterized protein YggE
MDGDSKLLKGVALVLALAVLASLVDAAMARRRAAPSAQPPRRLRVTASAFAEAEPDMARISLGVKATRLTPQEAAQSVSKTVTATKAALQKLGVAGDAIETSELYLGEVSEYDYQKRRYVRPRYKAYHWLRVTLKRDDFGKLALVCNAAVAAGVTSLSGLVFEVENDNALRAQALAKATARAREKADSMAQAAKTSITGIQSLSEQYWPSWYGGDRSEEYEYARAGQPAAAAEASPGAAAAPAEAPAGEPEVPGALRIDCQVEVEFLVS